MDEAIQELLDALEAAEAAGASLTDTVLRESLYNVVDKGFIRPVKGFRVPPDLLLDYTEAASRQNDAVINALEAFLTRARQWAEREGLESPEERESAFIESEATSTSGTVNVGEYFD
jgi:hypothetical protein